MSEKHAYDDDDSTTRKRPRVWNLPGGLADREAGFDFYVLSQFQFDAHTSQQWYTREIKSWSGIMIAHENKRNMNRINLSGVMLLQLPDFVSNLVSLILLYMPNNKSSFINKG